MMLMNTTKTMILSAVKMVEATNNPRRRLSAIAQPAVGVIKSATHILFVSGYEFALLVRTKIFALTGQRNTAQGESHWEKARITRKP